MAKSLYRRITTNMQSPTQEEKNQAMENMECWKTQEHLKECRKCAPVGNWKNIEEEFRKYFDYWIDDTQILKPAILAFFKPYFQERMHELVVCDLEMEDLKSEDFNHGGLIKPVDNKK